MIVMDTNKKAWFYQVGPDEDVVISSRVRCSRNISGFPFPENMDEEEKENVRELVEKEFAKFPGHAYINTRIRALKPFERKFLMEEGLISENGSLQPDEPLLFNNNRSFSCSVHDVDHLRFAMIEGGLNLYGVYKYIDDFDVILEKSVPYAVSLSLGYLTPDIANVGTGLKASVLVHLPGLEGSEELELIFKKMLQAGFSIKGFFTEAGKSLGSIYLVGNTFSLGLSEEEILETLASGVQRLVTYERKARKRYYDQNKLSLEDTIFRSYGTLLYCRKISVQEAIELLADIRFGIALDLLPVDYQDNSALFMEVQKYHVMGSRGFFQDELTTEEINFARAQIIQAKIGPRDTLVRRN